MTLGEFRELTADLADDTPIMLDIEDIYNEGNYFHVAADALVSTDKGIHNKTICSSTEIIIFEE